MPVIQLITALGCRPCERVKVRLAELQGRHPGLRVEEVDLLTDEGVALAARHRVWTLPALIVADVIVAEGDADIAALEAALGLMAGRA